MSRRPEQPITKLSDGFGQFTIHLTCSCGHSRKVYPRTLAGIAGTWDIEIKTLINKMRCTQCGERRCTYRIGQGDPSARA